MHAIADTSAATLVFANENIQFIVQCNKVGRVEINNNEEGGGAVC